MEQLQRPVIEAEVGCVSVSFEFPGFNSLSSGVLSYLHNIEINMKSQGVSVTYKHTLVCVCVFINKLVHRINTEIHIILVITLERYLVLRFPQYPFLRIQKLIFSFSLDLLLSFFFFPIISPVPL